MCDATAAISAGKAVAGYAAEQEKVNAENEARSENIQSAQRDNIVRNNAAQIDYQLDVKAQNQEEFDAVIAKRAAMSSSATYAASSGVTGKSVTNTLQAIAQAGNRNKTRLDDKEEVIERNYEARTRAIKSDLEQSYASNRFQDGPSPIGMVLGIAGAGLEANERAIARGGNGFLG